MLFFDRKRFVLASSKHKLFRIFVVVENEDFVQMPPIMTFFSCYLFSLCRKFIELKWILAICAYTGGTHKQHQTVTTILNDHLQPKGDQINAVTEVYTRHISWRFEIHIFSLIKMIGMCGAMWFHATAVTSNKMHAPICFTSEPNSNGLRWNIKRWIACNERCRMCVIPDLIWNQKVPASSSIAPKFARAHDLSLVSRNTDR